MNNVILRHQNHRRLCLKNGKFSKSKKLRIFKIASYSFLKEKGPSKNYVTVREGEGVDDVVTYRYVYFEGEGGIL